MQLLRHSLCLGQTLVKPVSSHLLQSKEPAEPAIIKPYASPDLQDPDGLSFTKCIPAVKKLIVHALALQSVMKACCQTRKKNGKASLTRSKIQQHGFLSGGIHRAC